MVFDIGLRPVTYFGLPHWIVTFSPVDSSVFILTISYRCLLRFAFFFRE